MKHALLILLLVAAFGVAEEPTTNPETIPLGEQLKAGRFAVIVTPCCSGIDINNPGGPPIIIPRGYVVSVFSPNAYSTDYRVTLVYRQDGVERRRTHEFVRWVPLDAWTAEFFSIGVADILDVLVTEKTPGATGRVSESGNQPVRLETTDNRIDRRAGLRVNR